MKEEHILYSNKYPYEHHFNSLKELKIFIKNRAKDFYIKEKKTSIVRFVKFDNGETFYYIKRSKK